MDVYRTEEEQVQAIKKWFKENGAQYLIVAGLALAIVFGYQWWKESRQSTGEAASIIYNDFMGMAQLAAPGTDKDGENLSTAKHLAQQLIEQYENTQYASYAALMLAKLAVQANDLEEAERQLRWVLAHSPDKPLSLTTNMRLARVIAANGSPEKGLVLIKAPVPSAWQAAYDEVRGDLHLQMGNVDDARQAYQRSVDAAAATENSRPNPIVQMKLDDLSV